MAAKSVTRQRALRFVRELQSTAQLDVLEIKLEDRHFEIAGSGLLLVEEEDPDIFFAYVGFSRIGLARTRHDANLFVVEFSPEIGLEHLQILDIGGLAKRD